MSTFQKDYERALAAAARGEIVKESELPTRGSAAWKALSASQKRLVGNARFARREHLRKEREDKSQVELRRWSDRLWVVHAGPISFHALANPDYSPRTAVAPAQGTVQIVVGNRLSYQNIVKLPASSDKVWAIKEALGGTYYSSINSPALARAIPVIKKIAAGKIKADAMLPDSTMIPDDTD